MTLYNDSGPDREEKDIIQRIHAARLKGIWPSDPVDRHQMLRDWIKVLLHDRSILENLINLCYEAFDGPQPYPQYAHLINAYDHSRLANATDIAAADLAVGTTDAGLEK